VATKTTRIGNLDIQFQPVWDPIKANQLVQSLQQVIANVNTQNAAIAAIAAAESAGVAPHVFASETGLGPEHTVSGLVPGNVVVATSETTAEFAALQFGQIAQVDSNTFLEPAQGDVITFIDGYWSAAPSNPLNLSDPGQNALVAWSESTSSYAWAIPDDSLIFAGGTLSVNQGVIVHANLEGLEYVVGTGDTLIANDHPQYALLAAANTWEALQTFAAGLVSDSDMDLTGNLEQIGTEPEWRIQNTPDTVDEGTWRIHAEPGQLMFASVSDDGSDGENWLTVTRIAEIVDQINLQGNSFTFNGDSVWTQGNVKPGNNIFLTQDPLGNPVINAANPGSGSGGTGPAGPAGPAIAMVRRGDMGRRGPPGGAGLRGVQGLQGLLGAAAYLRAREGPRGRWGPPGRDASAIYQQRGVTWSNALQALTTGAVQDVSILIPEDSTILRATILTKGGTGSCSVDIWTVPIGSYPPLVSNSICAGNYPSITAGQVYDSTALTGWNVTLPKGNTVTFHLRSTSVFTEIVLMLTLQRTGVANINGYTNAMAIGAVAAALANTGNIAFTYSGGAISANYAAPSPGTLHATVGYDTLASGTILQWGSVSAANSGGVQDLAVVFATPFLADIIVVAPVGNRSVASMGQSAEGSNYATNLSLTGCTISVDQGPSGTTTGRYLALGW
jgi:hypothetical protein